MRGPLKIDYFSLLPAELQIEIFDHLETVDAKAARAVSRRFCDNASPALFRSIVACARYRALDAYQKISQHPKYSGYVQEIIFDGTIYNREIAGCIFRYREAETEAKDVLWPASLYSYLWKTTPSLDASMQLRYEILECYDMIFKSLGASRSRCHLHDCRWNHYRTLCKEQEDMNSNGFLLQSLARGLKNMQNISSIVFSPNRHTIPLEKENLRDMVPTECNPPHVHHVDISPPDHPFRQLIYALFIAQYTGVRQLSIRKFEPDGRFTRFSPFMFMVRNVHDMHAAKYVFRHLLRIDLNICIPRHSYTVQFPPNVPTVERTPEKLLANLSEVLETAQDLQHLSVVLPVYYHWTCGGVSIHRRLGLGNHSMFCHLGLGATWPMLRSLRLQGIYATKQDLMDFVARHRDTLKMLKLTSCSMTEGLWSDVVDEVIFNAPMISTFVLDLVDEACHPNWAELSQMGINFQRYEGYMRIEPDGEREFVDSNPAKNSVYELRKYKDML